MSSAKQLSRELIFNLISYILFLGRYHPEVIRVLYPRLFGIRTG